MHEISGARAEIYPWKPFRRSTAFQFTGLFSSNPTCFHRDVPHLQPRIFDRQLASICCVFYWISKSPYSWQLVVPFRLHSVIGVFKRLLLACEDAYKWRTNGLRSSSIASDNITKESSIWAWASHVWPHLLSWQSWYPLVKTSSLLVSKGVNTATVLRTEQRLWFCSASLSAIFVGTEWTRTYLSLQHRNGSVQRLHRSTEGVFEHPSWSHWSLCGRLLPQETCC